jgi:hypothetical protein
VDDPNVAAVDQHQDGGSGVGSAEPSRLSGRSHTGCSCGVRAA